MPQPPQSHNNLTKGIELPVLFSHNHNTLRCECQEQSLVGAERFELPFADSESAVLSVTLRAQGDFFFVVPLLQH